MNCSVCGHRPHPGFKCNIPDGMDPMDLCECPFEERRSQQSLFFSPVEMNAVGSPTGRVQHEPAEASVIAARRTSAKSHRGIIMAAIAGHSVTSREAARRGHSVRRRQTLESGASRQQSEHRLDAAVT